MASCHKSKDKWPVFRRVDGADLAEGLTSVPGVVVRTSPAVSRPLGRYPLGVDREQGRPTWVVGHLDAAGSTPDCIRHIGPVSYPMSPSPLVSVISPTYRHRKYLDSTLWSVASQDYAAYEHLVVDGASADGTVEYLETCSNLQWLSEPDGGYVEAFHKGLAKARGQWVLQCAISDGWLVSDWITRCMEVFDQYPETALVWGVPRSMTQDGRLGDIVYPDLFPGPEQLSARDTFRLWLTRGFVLPEGNLCVRKSVVEELFPTVEECLDPTVEPWLEFTTRFHSAGYMAVGLPVVANYGRAHADSITASEFDRGVWRVRRGRFSSQVALARRAHVLRGEAKVFVDVTGMPHTATKLTARERFHALAWSTSDSLASGLRPGLGLLPDSTRNALRRVRGSLLGGR